MARAAQAAARPCGGSAGGGLVIKNGCGRRDGSAFNRRDIYLEQNHLGAPRCTNFRLPPHRLAWSMDES